jgi:CRP-like cAMP-binding protein
MGSMSDAPGAPAPPYEAPEETLETSPGNEVPEEERAGLTGRHGRGFSAGQVIFQEGEPAGEAFLLQEGRVRLLKRVRTTDRSLVVLKPGDLFGEAAILPAMTRNSTAIALTDGIAIVFDRTSFRPILEQYPRMAIRLLEQLTRRMRDAEDQIEIMMVHDTHSKIVAALLKLAQPATSGPAEIAVSPVDLSTRVGLDVETVKGVVKRLREQGYVRIVDERVEIPDIEALRRLYLLLGTKEELRGDTR